MAELKNMWKNRTTPVVYSSPYRELALDNSGQLSVILVGAYSISGVPGNDNPEIRIDNDIICSLSTLHATEQPNMYECVLDPPVTIGAIHIYQRYATRQIAFLHDGERDSPLISVNTISKFYRMSGPSII